MATFIISFLAGVLSTLTITNFTSILKHAKRIVKAIREF